MNLIISGVGGQGNLLASRVLATAAVQAGQRVAVGETYGASQRGGAVMSHVRIHPERTPGPLIAKGAADVILGLEPLETLRVLLDFGNPASKVFMNSRPIDPISCQSGEERYPEPEALAAAARSLSPDLTVVAAVDAALGLGNAAMANVVMLGALAAADLEPFGPAALRDALGRVLKPALLAKNLEAFGLGLELGLEAAA